MLDPRIYRTGLAAVALAVIVLAFSLHDQQPGLTSSLPPDAFSGQSAYGNLLSLARIYPERRPGSAGDEALAGYVAQRLRQYGFAVARHAFPARTADGRRTVENVVGSRVGIAGGSIVVVAARDAMRAPALGQLSGTAALIELARVLAGETQHHSIILASTSASDGLAGPLALAGSLGSVDAVIVLGDLASRSASGPVIVPFSSGLGVAPPMLRNTVATSLGGQAGLKAGGTGLGTQLARLALPLTLTQQGPFGARGQAAVLLSLNGERPAAADEATSAARLQAVGRTLTASVSALDGGHDVPGATPYLLFSGKVVPAWAIRLLVLALILPVLLTTVDGAARVRRRRGAILRPFLMVLARAMPMAVAVGLAVLARVSGLVVAPPGPVGDGQVALRSWGIVLLVAMALALLLGSAMPLLASRLRGSHRSSPRARGASEGQRPATTSRAREREEGELGGEGASLLLALCLLALGVWARNPYAALLLMPALHLWMWIIAARGRLHPLAAGLLVLGGLLAPAAVLYAYAHLFALGVGGLVWSGVLLLAGGGVGVAGMLALSLGFGSLASVITLCWRRLREPTGAAAPVTVRGPVTYAGPGSLGGTESALRR